MTAQGSPRAIFLRAIERGNVAIADTVMREMGRVTLHEALYLTALVALKEPHRSSRYAVRWLARFLAEYDSSIDEAALAAASLNALGGPAHDDAAKALMALSEKATSQPRGPRLAL